MPDSTEQVETLGNMDKSAAAQWRPRTKAKLEYVNITSCGFVTIRRSTRTRTQAADPNDLAQWGSSNPCALAAKMYNVLNEVRAIDAGDISEAVPLWRPKR